MYSNIGQKILKGNFKEMSDVDERHKTMWFLYSRLVDVMIFAYFQYLCRFNFRLCNLKGTKKQKKSFVIIKVPNRIIYIYVHI